MKIELASNHYEYSDDRIYAVLPLIAIVREGKQWGFGLGWLAWHLTVLF